MATIPVNQLEAGGKHVVAWGPMAEGDTCVPLDPINQSLSFATLQASGTFGGSVEIQGSNDLVSWVTLKDIYSNSLSLSSAGLYEISTAVRFVRPAPGVGVIGVSVSLCMRG